MAKLCDAVWNGLKRKLRTIASALTGEKIEIIEIPRSSGELGYTARNNAIFISRDHMIMDPMREKEKVAFIMGVFAHELMHRLITNFQEFEKVLRGLPRFEAQMFRDIYNVIEDPAIEEQAKRYIGGELLSCLHYSIMTLYRQAEPLEPQHPMAELLNALIMYGDGGFIKGEFTSDEAKSTFYRILPVIDRTITESNSKKRVQNAYEVFLLTKPLWEEEAKNDEAMRKLIEQLAKEMEECGKGVSGSGDSGPRSPEFDGDAIDPVSEKKKRRRKITFRKISKEEMEERKKSGIPGKDDGESDIEVLYCDEDESAKDDASSGMTPLASEDALKSPPDAAGSTPGESKGEDATKKENAPGGLKMPNKADANIKDTSNDDGSKETSKSKDNRSSEKDGVGPTEYDDGQSLSASHDSAEPIGAGQTPSVASDGLDDCKEEVIDDAEYELSSEDMARITNIINEIKEVEASNKREREECHSDDLDIPIVQSSYKGVSCLNNRVSCSDSSALATAYQNVVSTFSPNIERLISQMRRIINNDLGDREFRASGKVHVPRLYSSRMTCRVFGRNVDPANKGDMCVLFLVDESGSMASKNKSGCAMQCVICLAEVLARLHIPTKVIGFTADIGSYDVVHNHYMHWLNTYEERLNLTSITHRSNNFDGYSIRYATEMLKKRPEQHKILIVLSDGQPAARYYKGNNGIIDTTDAIKCANKKVDVIGVGIGNADEKVWRAMYGSSFIHVQNANDLLTKIGKAVQEIMKRW